MTTNPCPHTPTHWPLNMIACDTTSELRQLFEKTDGYAVELQKNGEPYNPDMYYLYKDVVALLTAQRQRWEVTARLDEVSLVPTLKTHRTTVDDVLIDLEVYKNNRKIELRTVLDGERGKEQ